MLWVLSFAPMSARATVLDAFSARAENLIPPRPRELVYRHLPTTVDGQLPKLRQTGSSLPAGFGLTARFGRYHRIVKLPMLLHVAVGTQAHKILKRVISLLAPLDLVMDLEILQRAALLTSPSVSLQHTLHQPPVDLLPQPDPLYLPQHLLGCLQFPAAFGLDHEGVPDTPPAVSSTGDASPTRSPPASTPPPSPPGSPHRSAPDNNPRARGKPCLPAQHLIGCF